MARKASRRTRQRYTRRMGLERHRGRGVWVSVLAHASLLLLLVLHLASPAPQVRKPGTAHGTMLALTYEPAGSSAATHAPQTHKAAVARKAKALPSTEMAASPAVHPQVSATASHPGTNALGEGDVTLALMQQGPDPQPDLSTLPQGTNGNVVVDVVIDEQGRIAQSTLVHGLGSAVDQAVLATLRNWTFSPALKNGVPVASRQELVFHYERA